MQHQERIDPYARFQVVFASVGAPEPLVLRSTHDADLATLAFYDERERLIHDHLAGDLLLIYHGAEERTLLRESLGSDRLVTSDRGE